MATKRFGTNAITGLNVGSAGHLIADHELQASVGGRTVVDGAWSTGRDHVTVHEGTAISAMACGRMGGQDHTVYVDGNNVLDTGSVVGTTTMGASPAVVPVDGKFLILGAADGKNKIYDGNHLRDHGPWPSDLRGTTGNGGITITAAAATYTVDAGAGGITKASNAKIYLTSVASLTVGMPIYLDGVLGMTEINGRVYEIQTIDTDGTPNWITINCDSTGFTTYTSAGTLHRQACGLTGDFRFAMTTTVELSDGSIIESKLLPVGRHVAQAGFTYTGSEPEAITLSPLNNVVFTLSILSWILSSTNQYNITGTIGTDYKPGIRIYRTKVDGTTDFYLEHEFQHGDTGLTYTTGSGYAYYSAAPFIYKPDDQLGALYAADATDHGSPPTSSLAAQVGQRIFINDVDNPRNIHVSGLDGGDYFDAADFIRMPDEVTSLNRVRDRLVASTAMRWYLIDMISGFPQIQEIDCSIGTRDANAIAVNDQGLFFMKTDGIYHLDLAKVTKISRRAISDADLDSGQAALVTADYGIFIGNPLGAGATVVAYIRDGGWVWHHARETLTHTHLGRNSYGQLLGALPTKIEMLFIGSDYYGTFTGKKFSDGDTWRTTKLIVDIECIGAATLTYQITTNRGGTLVAPQTYTLESTTRRIVELPVTRKVGETFEVNMAIDGNATVYGYAIEVET